MNSSLQEQVDEYRRLYGDELPIEFLEQFAVEPKDRATIDLLKKEIKKDGIKKPLRLECSGPRILRMGVDALLINGNRRLVAAKELGLKTVPTRIV